MITRLLIQPVLEFLNTLPGNNHIMIVGCLQHKFQSTVGVADHVLKGVDGHNVLSVDAEKTFGVHQPFQLIEGKIKYVLAPIGGLNEGGFFKAVEKQNLFHFDGFQPFSHLDHKPFLVFFVEHLHRIANAFHHLLLRYTTSDQRLILLKSSRQFF